MNGTFPLHQFPVRERTFMYALVGILSLVWTGMMFASANSFPGVGNGIARTLVASFLLMAAIGAVEMRALGRAREVLGTQPTPTALWRTWARACIVETSLLWAFVGAGMVLLLASRGSTMPWPAALALISTGLCIGAACMLAQYEMAPKRLGWLANGLAAAVLIGAVYSGTGRALEWFVGLPVAVHALLMFSWPLLAAILAQGLHTPATASGHLADAPGKNWQASLAKGIQRYSPLDASWAQKPHAEQSTARSRLNWLAMNAFYLLLFSDPLLPLRWDQQPDLRHLLSLVLMCLMMSHTLVARDLHWRWLLAPGGWGTGRIASAVFAPTVTLYFAAMAAVVLVDVLWTRLVEGTDAMTVIDTAASHVLLLAEVAFAISVGLVLRALPRRTVMEFIVGLTSLGLWIYAATIGFQTLWKAPAAGVVYGIVLVAATFAVMRLADRLWTKEKLLAGARGAA